MLGVNGSGATSCVLEVVESAVLCTDDRIEVAISIEICEGGFAVISDINAIEGVSRSCLSGVNGSGSTSRVFVVFESAVICTDDRIEVAIAIDIREGGSTGNPDINTIEGVSRTCLSGVNGSGTTSCVFVVFESAVIFTDDRIEVAIAIDIREGGSARIPDINTIEGVSCSCLRGVDARSSGEVVVGNGDLERSNRQTIETGICAGDSRCNYTKMSPFAYGVICCCYRYGLSDIPVGGGEGKRGDISAELRPTIEGNHHISTGLTD